MSVSKPTIVTVTDNHGQPVAGFPVYAFDGAAYTNISAVTNTSGQAAFRLPFGAYRFRADVNGVQLWSGAGDHCELPTCTATTVTAHLLIVSVLDGAAAAVADVQVYLFDGETYLNQTRTTDAAGQATFVVPAGAYRFRADLGGTQLWSGEANHCATSGCLAATILAPRVSVTVLDQDAGPLAGVAVYAFSGGEYQNLSTVTDEDGVATFVLPAGAYRFRADVGGTQLWSGASDDCLVPVCAAVSITAHFVTVSVQDQAALPLANVPVYLFSGETYLDLSGNTDETGQAVFVLPEGAFRFRADVGGTQLWSSLTDDCAAPGCTAVSVIAHFVTVLVESTGGTRHAGVPVYLFDGETYLDKSAVTDAEGAAVFVLPAGAYRFRADLFEVPFWSAEAKDCLIPGCLDVTVVVPGAEGVGGYVASTIDYVYDPLNRLTEADYDDETYFHYVYDPVGNRLTEETQIGATSYAYDVANRLLSVAGQAYTWDANGNLLSDGTSSYTYDKANRLVGVSQGGNTYDYGYNGLGDRVGQTVDGVTTTYTLDLAAGLTQVLSDGTNAYLYGLGRVGEQGAEWQYHLGDALGSVRQLTGADSAVTFAQSYAPYGSVLSSGGGGATAYGYTGEWTDGTGLVHLRARYLDAGAGRFISRDPWELSNLQLNTLNKFVYASGNPIRFSDPSGLYNQMPGLLAFAWCFDLHSGFKGRYPTVPSYLAVSATEAIAICRNAYSKTAWNFNLNGELPSTTGELFGWYVSEYGGASKEHLRFPGDHRLTRELTGSILIQDVREKYYRNGDIATPTLYKFNVTEVLVSGYFDFEFNIPLTQFLGSFTYQVRTLPNGRVGFRIDNDTTLESGTHIAGRFQDAGFSGSIEELIARDPRLANKPLFELIRDYRVISILKSQARSETHYPYGGGNFYQTFTWTEKIDPCLIQLFETGIVITSLLDIGVWSDYNTYTQPMEWE